MFRSLMTIIRDLYLYLNKVMFLSKHLVKLRRYTVIPRLTKTIRSGITFVSRNVFISAPGMARPFMFAALC